MTRTRNSSTSSHLSLPQTQPTPRKSPTESRNILSGRHPVNIVAVYRPARNISCDGPSALVPACPTKKRPTTPPNEYLLAGVLLPNVDGDYVPRGDSGEKKQKFLRSLEWDNGHFFLFVFMVSYLSIPLSFNKMVKNWKKKDWLYPWFEPGCNFFVCKPKV